MIEDKNESTTRNLSLNNSTEPLHNQLYEKIGDVTNDDRTT